ncbi:hypothetical protein KP509_24G066900 [Ceratopteris richardii]|nr:hypothetical protein KP509_24G066900 [Ceratopteris richardii]
MLLSFNSASAAVCPLCRSQKDIKKMKAMFYNKLQSFGSWD